MKLLALILITISFNSFALSSALVKFAPEQIQGDQVIDKKYYRLSYSNYHEQAEWVYYKLDKKMIDGDAERTDYFRKDPQVIEETPSQDDYTHSGYDRGHLVPAADMKLNDQAMRSTFVMSNVTPQVPSFNRQTWKRLESKIRKFAQKKGSLFIITGPVLENGLKTFSQHNISIPKRFYKIVFKITRGNIETISFLLPHKPTNKPLSKFVTTIDKIENITGIDFLKGLPDHIEDDIESKKGVGFWNL